ncbi:MAG: HAMP domain-containing protein [Actinomycetia bacterium]|nr:HAMP domain-containing protein [Actinomycetes bacterium]
MRRTLAGIALAVTTMVALSFSIPLSLLVRSEARTQAVTAAEQRAAALAPVLALTTDVASLRAAAASVDPDDRLAIHLPGGTLLGATHAPAALLRRAQSAGESLARDVPDGWVYLQPVVLGGGRVAVVEEFVPSADLSRGVAESWWVMAGLVIGLVLGSVFVADRLAARVVRSSRRLSDAAHALGEGDLDTRVDPMGPPELREAGTAFNAMAERMVQLLATERELVADLSHRLRTPLTALRLAAEQREMRPGAFPGPAVAGPSGPSGPAGPGVHGDPRRLTAAIDALEDELQAIIETARAPFDVRPAGTTSSAARTRKPLAGPGPDRAAGAFPGSASGDPAPAADPARCEAADVTSARAAFWAVLAREQDRAFDLHVTAESSTVAVPEDELIAVIDALAGNVFRHTPAGTAFAIRLERSAQAVTLVVEDAGPGIADPEAAVARGRGDSSTGPSTGLGLDIARRAASAARGSVAITRGGLGGARIAVTFALAAEPVRASRLHRSRRRGFLRSPR